MDSGRLGNQPLPARQSLLCLGTIQLNSDPQVQVQAQAQGSKHSGSFRGSLPTLVRWFPYPTGIPQGPGCAEQREVGVKKSAGGVG